MQIDEVCRKEEIREKEGKITREKIKIDRDRKIKHHIPKFCPYKLL